MRNYRSFTYLSSILIFFLLFFLDLGTKYLWAEIAMQNAVFSFPIQLIAVVGFMIVVLTQKTWFWGSFGLAGAGGNLFDRFMLGHVRDWISWSWNQEVILFSNLADLWLTMAVIGIGWSLFWSMMNDLGNGSTIHRW